MVDVPLVRPNGVGTSEFGHDGLEQKLVGLLGAQGGFNGASGVAASVEAHN